MLVGFPPAERRGGLGSEGEAAIGGDTATRVVEERRRCDIEPGPRDDNDGDKTPLGDSPCPRTEEGLDMSGCDKLSVKDIET